MVHVPAPPPAPARPVRVPVNVHRWDRIAFLHWPVDPAAVAALLPAGLRPITWDGAAWVGITPFVITVRPLGLPLPRPWGTFPETNMRTYVVRPGGEQGIWFLRMEVTHRWFVATLRTLGLPYERHRMRVDPAPPGGAGPGDLPATIAYRSEADAAGRGGHDIVVTPGARLEPPSGTARERALTARWDAFHRVGPLLLRTPVAHPAWALRRAEVERCEVGGMFRAVALPQPAEPPLVHVSPGVEVRVGAARPVTVTAVRSTGTRA